MKQVICIVAFLYLLFSISCTNAGKITRRYKEINIEQNNEIDTFLLVKAYIFDPEKVPQPPASAAAPEAPTPQATEPVAVPHVHLVAKSPRRTAPVSIQTRVAPAPVTETAVFAPQAHPIESAEPAPIPDNPY